MSSVLTFDELLNEYSSFDGAKAVRILDLNVSDHFTPAIKNSFDTISIALREINRYKSFNSRPDLFDKLESVLLDLDAIITTYSRNSIPAVDIADFIKLTFQLNTEASSVHLLLLGPPSTLSLICKIYIFLLFMQL